MEESKKFELADEELDTVAGGTGISDEERWMGWNVRAPWRRCSNCGHTEYKITDYNDAHMFVGDCLRCGTCTDSICPVNLSLDHFELWQG